jgi:hypothetical protein
MINHSRRLPPQTISTRVLAAAVSLSFWFAIREPKTINRRVEQLAACRVHTPEVAGSSPASATSFTPAVFRPLCIGFWRACVFLCVSSLPDVFQHVLRFQF